MFHPVACKAVRYLPIQLAFMPARLVLRPAGSLPMIFSSLEFEATTWMSMMPKAS